MKKISVFALLFVLAVSAGCGPDFGPIGAINGTLTLDGKAVGEGTKVIFMQPTSGEAGFGLTDASGAYSIEWRHPTGTYDGLPIGVYQVMLVPAGAVEVDELSADEMLDGGAPKSSNNSKIPAKYLRLSTSGLEFTIKEGENVIDIPAMSK